MQSGNQKKKFLIHPQQSPHVIEPEKLQKYLPKQTAQGQFIIITKSYGMTVEDQNTRNIHCAH